LNERQIKKAYYHTIHLYEEQTRTIRGRSLSRATGETFSSGTAMSGPATAVEGWFPDLDSMTRVDSESSGSFSSEHEGESEVEVPIFVPIPVKELTSETEWSREEKVSRVAEMLKYQQQRHCFIKLDTEKTQPLKIPFVRDFRLPVEDVDEYQRELYHRQGALPAAEVDRLISESQQAFLSNLRLKGSTPIDSVVAEEACSADDEDFFDSFNSGGMKWPALTLRKETP
jgi:hypothetical protein